MQCSGDFEFDLEALYEEILRYGPEGTGIISESQSDVCDGWKQLHFIYRRKAFVKKYSWAVPSKEAVQKIAEFIGKSGCLEVCAGSGLWSRLLKEEGVDIVATDDGSDVFEKSYAPVIKMSAQDAILHYQDRSVLFVCWAYCSLEGIEARFKGDKIVYIGECRDGLTGCIPDDRDWEEVESLEIPRWPPVHDYVALYRRRKKSDE